MRSLAGPLNRDPVMPMSRATRLRLAVLGGVALSAIAAFIGIKLLLLGPPATGVVSITSDFPLESAGPTLAAFDAVQTNVERFGAVAATKEYIAMIHAGRTSSEVACFVVSVTADGTPARFLLQVDRVTMTVSVSEEVGGAWQASAGDRAATCEGLEPAS